MKTLMMLAASTAIVCCTMLMPSMALAYEWKNGNEVWNFDAFQDGDGGLVANITGYRQVDEYGVDMELPDDLSLVIPSTVTAIWTNELGYLENEFDEGIYAGYNFITTKGPEVTNVTIKVTVVDLFRNAADVDSGKVTSLTFPDTVAWVGGFRCTNLTTVVMSDEVRFYGGAFIGSPWLKSKGEFVIRDAVLVAYQGSSTSVTVPEGVVEIGDYAFSAWGNVNLTNLTSVTLPESVESIGFESFQCCEKLAAINIPDSVTSIDAYAFEWCGLLADVKLPAGLDYLGYGAFCGTALSSIEIPDGIDGLEGRTFSDCTNLTSVTFHNTLESIGDYTFDNCPALASIELPDSLESIGDCAFNTCTSLSEIALPDSLERIGYSAFKNCEKLATVTGGENVKEIGSDVFADTALYNSVKDGIVQAGTLVVGCNGMLPATLGLPDGVTCIAYDALCGNTNITSLSIPASVHTIESYAFYGCENLTNISGGKGVQRISNDVFYGTPYADAITNNCDNGEVEFDFVRLGDVILSYQGVCPATVEIPDGVTQICSYLFDCDDPYNHVTPSNITSVVIGSNVMEIGDNAFNGLENLATVTGGGDLDRVGSWAFGNCPKLTDVSLAGPLTWLEPTTFYRAFSLTNVEFELAEPDDSNEFFISTDLFYFSDKLASVKVTFPGYTLEGWEARAAGPAFEMYADELMTFRLFYKQWYGYNDDDWYPALINYRAVWSGGEEPEEPTETETPTETEQPTETETPAETGKPTEAENPSAQDQKQEQTQVPPTQTQEQATQTQEQPTQTQAPMPTLWMAAAEGQSGAVQGQVLDNVASVYDGLLLDAAGNVAGTVKAKVGKAKNGVAKITVAIVTSAGEKSTVKSTLDIATGKVDGMDLTLGANGMVGTYGAYAITGSRNLFSSKSEQGAANDMLRPWLGPVNVAWRTATSATSSPYHALTMTVANKGKIKVSGALADGTKVSANGQLVIGTEWFCAPVTWEKKGKKLAFTLWLAKTGDKVLVYGLDGAIASKPRTLKGGSTFHVDASSVAGLVNGALTEYMPDGIAVTGGATWTVAKAGSISYKNGAVDTSKAGGNPSGLKLTYKAKDGTFKGSFTVYALQSGKLKKVKANVTGVIVDGVGYGAAAFKKSGSVAVTVE